MTSATALAPKASSRPPGYARRWWVLGVVMAAEIIDLVDSTVVTIAGPSVQADLGGGRSTLQWIIAAYTLALAVGLITSARAGDLVGRRPMFLVGMAGFTLSSLACGLAPAAGALIAFRVLQGLFGAVMIPQGLAMVRQSFPAEELGKAFAPMGPIMALGGVVGPILGGFLIRADLFGSDWRPVFLINVPIGLAGLVVAVRTLPSLPRVPGVRLDPLGSALISVASAGLVYPLVQGQELGWPVWTYLMIAGSLVAFWLFARNERRSKHPVLEPGLFTHRGFVAGMVFLGTFFVGLMSMSLITNLYLQTGLGLDTARTGLALMPIAAGMTVGAIASGAGLSARLGRRVLHLGLAATSSGLAWFGLTVGAVQHPSVWLLAPSLALTGLGSGLIVAPLFDFVLADLRDSEVGSGSGLLNAGQQFAGALGAAVLGTLFFHWQSEGAGVATRNVMWVTVACMAVSAAAAFPLPRRPREDADAH
jgi:EmrB/QacA subfamily drug resistance transporter